MAGKSIRTVACPHCGAPVEWSEASRYRPFCSARCKGLDLGAWASGDYVIPVVKLEDEIAEDHPENELPN